MNWPGAAARRRSIAGAPASSTSSVCSIITTASAPRGTTPPVAIVVAVPGVDLERRRMAAGDHFGVEREAARRGVARAGGVGGAQRKAIDIGAVERRHVDRRQRRRAPARGRARPRARRVSAGSGARSRWRSKRARASSAETTSRNCSCRAARRTAAMQIAARLFAGGSRPVAHGHGLITTSRAGRIAFAVGRHQNPAVGLRQRRQRQIARG